MNVTYLVKLLGIYGNEKGLHCCDSSSFCTVHKHYLSNVLKGCWAFSAWPKSQKHLRMIRSYVYPLRYKSI